MKSFAASSFQSFANSIPTPVYIVHLGNAMLLNGRLGLAVCVCLAFAGCGPGGPPLPSTVEAGGTVYLDDKPLDNANVMFTPEAGTSGVGSSATTDANGKYVLETAAGTVKSKGAPVGKYKVSISKIKDKDGKVLVLKENEAPMNVGGLESLPPAYSSPVQTELKAEIPAGGKKDIDFKLSSSAGGGAGGAGGGVPGGPPGGPPGGLPGGAPGAPGGLPGGAPGGLPGAPPK